MADPSGYILSEADRNTLQEMIIDWRNKRRTPRPKQVDETWLSPEVYMAYTPSGGIPSAISNAYPGSADCDIYVLQTWNPSPSFSRLPDESPKTVWNWASAAVAGSSFVPVMRTKDGVWIVSTGVVEYVGTGTGTDTACAFIIQDEGIALPCRGILNLIGANVTAVDNPGFGRTDVTISAPTVSGPGWLAGLATSQCLTTTVYDNNGKCSSISGQTHVLQWDSGTSKWISPNNFSYDGGSGKVRFSNVSGVPTLSIDNIVLVYDSAGQDDTGKYVDWKGGANLSTALCTDGTLEACGGNTFTLRLRCAWCPQPCCANYESPATLYLTVTSISCPAMDRVVTLPIATTGVWAGYAWYAPTGNNGRYWMLVCNTGTWQLHIVDKEPDGTEVAACQTGSGFAWKALTANDCSPYDFSFSYSGAVSPGGNGLGACLGLTCPDPTDFTFTITA